MGQFYVKRFVRGRWDEQPERIVEAPDPKSAAEQVCELDMTRSGQPEDLYAQVRQRFSCAPPWAYYAKRPQASA